MSIMAFELPIIEIAFALSELEFKKSTFTDLELLLLEIDFRIWVLTFLMATLGHRNLGEFLWNTLEEFPRFVLFNLR